MKTSTKNKILDLLKENLSIARAKKSASLKALKRCEDTIRTCKKNISAYSKSHEACLKSVPEIVRYDACNKIRNLQSDNHKTLKSMRKLIPDIRADIQKAKIEVRKWNDLINEVDPYKK